MEPLSPFFKLIHDFLIISLPKEQKCSENTIRSYRKSLEMLLDYVKAEKNIRLDEITFEMIDRQMLSGFLDYLEEDRKCSPSTRNQRLHAINSFYRYAAQEDITTVSYFEEIQKVKKAKVEEKLIEHMSEKAVSTILQQPDTSKDIGKRDAFLMLFLYKTAARVQELVDVKIKDIQLGESPRVTLHGKGNKARVIPLREDVTRHLESYLLKFHSQESRFSEQYLFYTMRSNSKKRMSEANVRSIVRKYGRMARKICSEVPENVHPHLFRHSWAMTLYQNGVELTLISQWLGHAQFETTLIYAHADTEIKRKAIEKAVPESDPLKEILNPERYTVNNEELLKQLCGLK